MTRIVDLVNFNADASCLSSRHWLDALVGGATSQFCRWLELYVTHRHKLVLGLTGGTVADLAQHNPQAIDLINGHPKIFQLILRPFSHDVALMRSRLGFQRNFSLGRATLRRHFEHLVNHYLPPEFMLSAEQVALLEQEGVQCIFVNAQRLAPDIRNRIPDQPYVVQGIGKSKLPCLPVAGEMTQHYLDTLHSFDASGWHEGLKAHAQATVIVWRDGESPFLIPDGLQREEWWLAHTESIEHTFLTETRWIFDDAEAFSEQRLRGYPVHSFLAWMKEFRMMGYLFRLQKLEERLADFSSTELALWLQAINSDVLSSVEKRSPVVSMRHVERKDEHFQHTILRSERGLEGEERLSLLEASRNGWGNRLTPADENGDAHLSKLAARMDYIQQLESEGYNRA